jgi:hypothetical protein
MFQPFDQGKGGKPYHEPIDRFQRVILRWSALLVRSSAKILSIALSFV